MTRWERPPIRSGYRRSGIIRLHGLDFAALTEVSVNLYPRYAFQKVLKKDIYQARMGYTREDITKLIKMYINEPDYATWARDPRLPLYTFYYPMIDAFGGKVIKKLNAALRKIYNSIIEKRSRTGFTEGMMTSEEISTLFYYPGLPVKTRGAILIN